MPSISPLVPVPRELDTGTGRAAGNAPAYVRSPA
jgi:hypothetical protein